MYGKTGKMRQKEEVQVRLKKQASGPDLLLEKMLKKYATHKFQALI
jgi:hypothetical protein